MNKEQDYFYWKNEQGIPERHHVSECERIIFCGTGESKAAAGENTRFPVREAGGENTGKDTGQSVR